MALVPPFKMDFKPKHRGVTRCAYMLAFRILRVPAACGTHLQCMPVAVTAGDPTEVLVRRDR